MPIMLKTKAVLQSLERKNIVQPKTTIFAQDDITEINTDGTSNA